MLALNSVMCGCSTTSRAHRTARESALRLSRFDALTGLFTRGAFFGAVEREIKRVERSGRGFCLVMLDLDDLKPVNDTFGHLAGDSVIRQIAEIIRRSVRVFDVCTRFGGEEFAIVMPGSAADDAVRVAERIRQRIEMCRPVEIVPMHTTASIGIAISSGDLNVPDLISEADRALYLAKRDGKNQTRMMTPPEDARPPE